MDGAYVNRFDIVTVPYPYDDYVGNKVRPAICLTNETGPHRHVVLAFISSRVPDVVEPSMLLVQSADSDFGKTGLKVDSVIMLHRLVTFRAVDVIGQLGALETSRRDEVKKKLKALFDLEKV